MDGNGRWAQQRGLPRLDGHRAGADSVRDVTRYARERGLEALTLYAFSAQNWARPVDEVAGLMQLLRDFLHDERAEIMDNGIRLDALGDIDRMPALVREPLAELRAASAGNRLKPEELDADRLGAFLPTANLPPLDLMIRTSGEQRVSNFMLWEIAYAELMFVDVLWPDFRRGDLAKCLDAFESRERRFGLTSAQLADSSDV
jgi:undecaprenyl diphosphate synthase